LSSFLIRYAIEFTMGFSHEEDARRVLAVLPKQFAKYWLMVPLTRHGWCRFRGLIVV
jgi:hypothetical protein